MIRDEENLNPDERTDRGARDVRDVRDEAVRGSERADVVREPAIEREKPANRLTTDELFPEQDRGRHQKRWESIQTSFVDDPRRAVEDADALVAELTRNIQETFARQRQRLEGAWSQGGNASTEDLRQALQQYRAYFTRLLAL